MVYGQHKNDPNLRRNPDLVTEIPVVWRVLETIGESALIDSALLPAPRPAFAPVRESIGIHSLP